MGIFSEEELAADAVTDKETLPEPVAEPAPEPQTPPDPDAERARGPDGKFVAKEADDAGDKPQGQVPQGALHAERERRKTAEAEARKFREQLDAINAMREQVRSRQPEPLPEANADDAGIQHLRERLAQLEQQQTRTSQTIDNQALDQAENEQISGIISASEAAFRAEQPDYDEAGQYLLQARARELQLHGLSQVEVNQALRDEARDVILSAVRQGKSPASMFYDIAQARGYRPAQAEQPAAQPQGGAAATLAAIGQAKTQSRSLGQASGTTPQTLNAETLASMSNDEFEAIYSTPEGKRMIDAL